tara:strand:+ start:52 stop:744 length:693 start_codon:yes stop_codon:yes gene_type:complete
MKPLLTLISLSLLLLSCGSIDEKETVAIDYTNNKVLDSIYKLMPNTTDTMFLGFTMGMTENEYDKHAKKLQEEGKSIKFESVIYNTAIGEIKLGPGYVFRTPITSGVNKKSIGDGTYYLEPKFSIKGGKLIELNIASSENWEDYDVKRDGWLENKIKENSSKLNDNSFKKALSDNNVIEDYNFIRQKENLIICETHLGLKYVSRKTLIAELILLNTEKEIIEKENEDIAF